MINRNQPPIGHFIWGRLFTDARVIYRSSPYETSISENGFVGRLRKRYKLMGELSVNCILRALQSSNLNYEGGGGIYFFKQISTGLTYFGRSDCPEERLESHLRYYPKMKCRLHVEMKKFGPEDFECGVIFQGDILRRDLRKIEKALIRSENTIWPNGLNVA